MGCSTYLGLGWRYQPLAPGHPTSICDIGVNMNKFPTSVIVIMKCGVQAWSEKNLCFLMLFDSLVFTYSNVKRLTPCFLMLFDSLAFTYSNMKRLTQRFLL